MARKSRPSPPRGRGAAGSGADRSGSGIAAEFVALGRGAGAGARPGFRWWILAGAALGTLVALIFVRPDGLPALGVVSGVSAGAAVLVAAAFALFGACTAWLCITDVRERRLPNSVVWLATVGLTVPLSTVSLVWGSPVSLGLSWATAAAFAALVLFAWLVAPRSIGAGDVKLAPAAGFLPAWVMPLTSLPLLVICVLGALVIAGSVALARRRRSVPLGPVILGASWAVALAGPEIWRLIGG